jgi:hypothetical protein
LDRSGNGFDFFLGSSGSVSSDDPTFTGTVGGLSSGEYWAFDGGDFFSYDTTAETWMQNLHKNSARYSILAWLYLAVTSDCSICGDASGPKSDIGMEFKLEGASPSITITNGSGTAYPLRVIGEAISIEEWHLVGISINEPTGSGGGFFYADGAYNQHSGADTFDATYSSPSSSAASHGFNIAARGNDAIRFRDGSRLAGFMAWEGTALTKANFDTIWAESRGRFEV